MVAKQRKRKRTKKSSTQRVSKIEKASDEEKNRKAIE
jgi:hypothetical protein